MVKVSYSSRYESGTSPVEPVIMNFIIEGSLESSGYGMVESSHVLVMKRYESGTSPVEPVIMNYIIEGSLSRRTTGWSNRLMFS